MRIASLLPAATEILFAIGAGDEVVAVTHECDYPPPAKSKPSMVKSRLPLGLHSEAIDGEVARLLKEVGSPYELDLGVLRTSRPDLVVTQGLCDVCAPSPGDLAVALTKVGLAPAVVELDPHHLSDILRNIMEVGEATGRGGEARGLVEELRSRIDRVRARASDAPWRPRVFAMEWLEPPYASGHWVPEMVGIAGGREVLGTPGRPARAVAWGDIWGANPEVVLLMPCGFDLDATQSEVQHLGRQWKGRELLEDRQAYALDGSSHFSRPGPRVVEGLETLAHILHPELFPRPPSPGGFARFGA
jgi:iron complex transport system substrate-binding protein